MSGTVVQHEANHDNIVCLLWLKTQTTAEAMPPPFCHTNASLHSCMCRTLVRTEMDTVPKPRVTPVLEKVPYRFPDAAIAAQGSTGTRTRCWFHCITMPVAVDRRANCGTRRVDVADDLGSSGIITNSSLAVAASASVGAVPASVSVVSTLVTVA